MQAWDQRLAAIDGPQAAARAGALFDAAGPPQPLCRGANLVFYFERRGGGGAYLRLIHEALRGRAEVEASSAFLDHVERAGAPVPRPLRSRAGRWVETLEVAGEPVVASAVTAVPGRAVEPVAAEYAAFGRALAALHDAAARFRPAPGSFRRHWETDWRTAVGRLPADDAPARAEAAWLARWLESLPRGPTLLGTTHADCNRTNALYAAGRVHLIDFDEPTFHWFAADVARPFRELTPEHAAHAACRAALLAGYREVRALDPRMEEALPGFVRLKNLEVYAWLLDTRHWAGDALPGGRERGAELDAIRATFPTGAAAT